LIDADCCIPYRTEIGWGTDTPMGSSVSLK
jgi:hypothetical protein